MAKENCIGDEMVVSARSISIDSTKGIGDGSFPKEALWMVSTDKVVFPFGGNESFQIFGLMFGADLFCVVVVVDWDFYLYRIIQRKWQEWPNLIRAWY